jgi:hypothetical protein
MKKSQNGSETNEYEVEDILDESRNEAGDQIISQLALWSHVS